MSATTAANDPAAPPTSSMSEADAFRRGQGAFDATCYDKAAQAFEMAFALDRNPATLRVLGMSYIHLHKPNAAARALEAYLAQRSPLDEANAQSARDALERLRANAGRIELQTTPAGAEVRLDEEVVEVANGELLAEPGMHHLTVSSPSYRTFSRLVDVAPRTLKLHVVLEPSGTDAPSSTDTHMPATRAVARSAADSEPAEAPPRQRSPGECLWRAACLGPVLTLLGLPNLVGAGLLARFGDYFAVSVDYQLLPKITYDKVSLTTSLVSAGVRFYPLQGAFFVTGAFGYQTVESVVADSDHSLAMRSGFPVALFGFGLIGRSGVVVGIDFGAMIPLTTPKTHVDQVSRSSSDPDTAQANLRAAHTTQADLDHILKSVPALLQVNLLRLGYIF